MFKRILRLSVFGAIFSIGILNNAHASTNTCPQFFLNGQAPDIVNPKIAAGTVNLCFDGFSVTDSPVSMGPIWSADHLTREIVENARQAGRNGQFHQEPNLPPAMQATLNDFKNTRGVTFWDRGHMTPNGDQPTAEKQAQTFTLANMIPQDSDNNEVLWAGIENTVREIARVDDDVYVVTGPIFYGSNIQRLNGRILIPTYIFKAFYDRTRNIAGVYITPNASGMNYASISLNQLKEISGVDAFPSLDNAIKQTVARLPVPKPSRHSSRQSTEGGYKLGSPQEVDASQWFNAKASVQNNTQSSPGLLDKLKGFLK